MSDKPRIEIGTLRLFGAVERGELTAEEAFEAWILEYHGRTWIRNPKALKDDIRLDARFARAIGTILARIRDEEFRAEEK